MAYDAFWIEECTFFLLVNHGPGSRRAKFPSKGFLQHLAHFEELFKRLHKVNMKIHPKKCEFAITLIVYLRQRILPNGIMAH